MKGENTYQPLLDKLIAGNISPSELQALQRASLDDPFLEEAIEGYTHNNYDQKAIKRLQEKISPSTKTKQRRLFPLTAIAASVAGLLVVSMWLFNSSHEENNMSAEKAETTKTIDQKLDNASLEEKEKINPEQSSQSLDLVAAEEEAEVKIQAPKQNSLPTVQPKGQIESKRKKIAESHRTDVQNNISKDHSIESNRTDRLKEVDQDKELLADIEEKRNPSEQSISESDLSLHSNVVLTKEDIQKEKQRIQAQQGESPSASEGLQENTLNKKEKTTNKSKKKVAGINTLESRPVMGVVSDSSGKPLAGVDILDYQRKRITSTDETGQFFVEPEQAYIMSAFSGYDTLTVSVQPKLNIQMQKSSKSLGQPHKRLEELMTDQELQRHYINQLNDIFSSHWPLCDNSAFSGQSHRIRNFVIVNLTVNSYANLSEIELTDEISSDCARQIEEVLFSKKVQDIFIVNRALQLRLRINL